MDTIPNASDLDGTIDVLGHQAGLRGLYTQICLCYSLSDTASHSTTIEALTKGLERLTASFPWVAGQVVSHKIKPFEKIPRLIVKDLREDLAAPTMEALQEADFPMSILDESVVCPRNTLPIGVDPSDPAPVLLLQANFIQGGLLLTINGQHNVMDMVGQAQVIDLLDKACRNEPFMSEELSAGNLPRHNIIPLLNESGEHGFAHQTAKPNLAQSAPTEDSSEPAPPPPTCSWAGFIFPSKSLAALKLLATKTLPPSCSFISTDDAVSAFIWQSIQRARLPRLDPSRDVKFARAIDARRFLGISPLYTGLVTNMTNHAFPLEQLLELRLGAIASDLRAALDPKTSDIAYRTRALVTALSREQDTSNLSITATLDLSADLMLSSWANVDCYKLDFGLGLGKPVAVRRPRFTPVESLIYLMPKSHAGEMAVAVSLRDEDLERLNGDAEWTKYTRFVG